MTSHYALIYHCGKAGQLPRIIIFAMSVWKNGAIYHHIICIFYSKVCFKIFLQSF